MEGGGGECASDSSGTRRRYLVVLLVSSNLNQCFFQQGGRLKCREFYICLIRVSDATFVSDPLGTFQYLPGR